MKIVSASTLLEISKNYEDHRVRREGSWYGYTEEKTWGAFPFAVSYLYRGQNTRHTPMLPSIARGLQSTEIREIWNCSISDQAKLIFRLAQSWWFSRELEHHPISHNAARHNLDLDPIALAQHYGIPTGYLDLSDDFNVSAFFATCRETKNGWEPVNTGIGIIYRVKLNSFKTPFGRYIPLGPQQLPRPSEQCAWVTELPLGHSFEGWPDVDMLLFHHDQYIGEHFLKMYEGGKCLFPPDPLSIIAEEILSCREIPVDLVDAAFDSFANDPSGILKENIPVLRKEIALLATKVSYRRLLTDQLISPFLADKEWREKTLSDVNVKWRAIRRIPISKDEKI